MKSLVENLNAARAALQSKILSLRAEADALESELRGNSLPSAEAEEPALPRLGGRYRQVLEFVRNNPKTTSLRVAKHLRCDRRNACSRLNRLYRLGFLVKEGKLRHYRWSVK